MPRVGEVWRIRQDAPTYSHMRGLKFIIKATHLKTSVVEVIWEDGLLGSYIWGVDSCFVEPI